MGKFSTQKARQIQWRLANLVDENDNFNNPPQRIAGLDAAYLGSEAVGAAILLSFPDLQLIEQQISHCKVTLPYIPTLLSFREFAPISMAFSALQKQPDICFVDAHGQAHPYKLGAASHFGVLRNVPTIGVAKTLLCGRVQTGNTYFDEIYLEDELIGARVTSKEGCNPIFISTGHRISLSTAVRMTLSCTTKYRLPEPTRLAHHLATETRRRMKDDGLIE